MGRKLLLPASLAAVCLVLYLLWHSGKEGNEAHQKHSQRLPPQKVVKRVPQQKWAGPFDSLKGENRSPDAIKTDEARKHLSKDVEFLRLALADLPSALKFLDRWLFDLSLDDFDAVARIANWLETEGHYQKASEVWRRMLEIEENDPAITSRLVNSLRKMGRKDLAQEILRDRAARRDNPEEMIDTYRLIAEQTLERDGPEEEIAFLREIYDLNPNNSALATDLGLALMENEEFDEANRVLQEQLRKNPKDPEALFGMGALHLTQGDLNQAEKYFKYNLSVNPNHVDSKYNLADLYTFNKKSNLTEAEAHYREVLTQVPESLDAQNGLAAVYLQSGREAEAVDLWRELADSNPDETVLHSNLGEAYYKTGNFEEASRSADQALAADPDNADAYYYKALAEKELGNQDLYQHYYREAIARDPGLSGTD